MHLIPRTHQGSGAPVKVDDFASCHIQGLILSLDHFKHSDYYIEGVHHTREYLLLARTKASDEAEM